MVFYMESIADEGSALIPILQDNGKALKELGGRAAIISEDDAKSLEDYTVAQTALANAFTKLKVAIANTGIVNLVTVMVNKFASLVDWFSELPQPIQQVGVAIGAFVLALGPLLVAVGTVISASAPVIAALKSIGASMASTGSLSGALQVAFAALRGAVGALITALGPLAVPLAVAVAAFVLFRDQITEALSKVFQAASSYLGPKLEALFDRLSAVVGAIISGFEAFARSPIIQFLGDLIGKLIEVGGIAVVQAIGDTIDIINGLLDVITRTAAAVKAIISGDWKTAWTLAGSSVESSVKTIIRSMATLFPPLRLLIELLERAGLIEKSSKYDPVAGHLKKMQSITPEELAAGVASGSGTKPTTTNVNPAIPTKGSKGNGAKKSASSTTATAAEQQRELDRLADEELSAKLALTTDADERADISRELLTNEKMQRIAEIQSNKDFTAEQKKAQLAYIERLYGGTSTNDQIVVDNALYTQKLNREIAEEQARQANDMLSRQAETLQAWAGLALNTKERARLEGEALLIQQQIQRNLLEQQIASGEIAKADADQARAQLASQQAADREGFDRQNASPLQQYSLGLKTAVANINDAMEGIQVTAMQSLTDGIAGAIAGAQKLGDVFKNVAQQIIADLVRIQLQKAVVGALGNLLGGGSGGPLSGFSFESSWFNDPTAVVKLSGAYASGTSNAARGLALVGERGPELVKFRGGEQVYNNADSKALMDGRAGNSGGDIYYIGPGAEEFWGKVNGVAASNANQAVVTNKQRDTRRAARKLGR
ncbi:phage tail tape measure protein [Novosphingobium clariflavum]|uniref:Uncharacterized protein n=1 Tax=Novosphingobium clariflavum TaxID=2029884 RepID=A0ABV6S5W7_9SPHN|nr:hypothetical protein [Novosphingobium clariflavum]